jgi:hypothetical protein
MRFVLALFLALAGLAAAPAHAQVVSVERWTEEWDAARGAWVRVDPGAQRFVESRAAAQPEAIAQYGPFRVVDGERAQLVDVTESDTPAHFAAMLRAHPGLATLEMIDCPGTEDDQANLRLGRMIRAAGIATHVPPGGSVRSGAVELFIAGATRRIDDGAEFAVHSWIDERGREAHHYAADAPEHRAYLAYYREMGMGEREARAFYAMTNSVGFDSAKWLGAGEMRGWLGMDEIAPEPRPEPSLAYLDLPALLP